MESGLPCDRELYYEEHCIFHSKKRDKDAKLFQQKLDEIFKKESLKLYDFSEFAFPEGVAFPEKIDKEIIFRRATFHGFISFGRKTFEEQANFRGATFEGCAIFSRTVFKKSAWFLETTFKGMVEFLGVEFQGVVGFRYATFEEVIVIDEETKENKIFSKEEVDFRDVRFLKPERVSFKKVNLSKFRFFGTDLRKVEFVDVEWDMEKGRSRIYDEIVVRDYPLIAQVYKRLRANYEENLNYAEAGDFHIGEMEMRRKGEKKPFNKIIISLYKFISNYGESYWRPLVFWILPILILFPVLFMYSGIEKVSSGQTSVIDYDFDISSISLNESVSYLKDYTKSFVYSFSVFSLVREKQYKPIDDKGYFLLVAESIASPVLIAFLFLALRRRFRR